MTKEVQLIGVHSSPYCCRVEIALKIKGVQYEFIEEDLSNKSPLLLNYNPVHKKIPVFVHNGKPIPESLIILEYIDETWNGTPILPEDPYDRAITRFWSKFIDEKCYPALVKVIIQGEGEDEAKECLQTLEDYLKGKKFFGGDKIGVVDIVSLFIAYWLILIQEVSELKLLTKENFPNLCAWGDEIVSCPVVKESLVPRDELSDYVRIRLAGFPSASKYMPN